ncbi:MAG TPA: hypothetical protein VNI83_12040 [Vicinamibacterales bacterium]|nr:hypothetical protein [Vicinamibacterales bacterium]
MLRRSRDDRRAALLAAAVLTLGSAGLAARQPAGARPETAAALSAAALEIACGPMAAFKPPSTALQVIGSLTDAEQLYAPWHRLVINAGADHGLKPGQLFYVRRVVRPPEDPSFTHLVTTRASQDHRQTAAPGGSEPAPVRAFAIMTAGWIRLDAVEPARSIATILHACDGVMPGDYLEPFVAPVPPPELPDGTPDYASPARVLFGVERRALAGGRTLVVIDRGAKAGLKPGQRFTFFRPSAAGPNVIVAEGIALLVSDDATMTRVERMRDAVLSGDFAAIHR